MSLLYTRSNSIWPFLIRHRLTHAVWQPYVRVARRRHLGFRRRLEREGVAVGAGAPVYGGV